MNPDAPARPERTNLLARNHRFDMTEVEMIQPQEGLRTKGRIIIEGEKKALNTAKGWKDEEATTFWTDGSRDEEGHIGAGVAWWQEDEEKSQWGEYSYRGDDFYLGNNKEVFDAELYAVVMAIKRAAQRETIRSRRVAVFTDSQATLTRIQSDQEGPGQHMTKMLFHWERKLEARGIGIEYRWVPAHKGVPGNERADYLAKFATEMRTYAWYGEHAAFVEQRSLTNVNRSAREKQSVVFSFYVQEIVCVEALL